MLITRCRILSVVALAFVVGCFGSSDDPMIWFERGNLLTERGQLDEAVNEYSRAVEALPDDPQIVFRRGLCYERLNLNEKALADYARCLEIEPTHIDAINNKGVVLARLQRFAEAAEEFSRLIDLQPNNVLALRNRGLCYHDLQQFDDALADYNAALKKAPDDVNTWFQRGNVYLEQGEFEAAEADFSKAIEVDDSFAKAWMNRGVARFGLNDRVAGIDDLKEAQQRDDNIVVPAIDWESFDDVAEMAPVTELTVGKIVVDPEAASWQSCRSVAEDFLRDKGAAKLVVLDESPQHRCMRMRAEIDDEAVEVYVGCQSDDGTDAITLPAFESQSDLKAILLVVRYSTDTESDEQAVSVDHFEDDWSPSADSQKPVLVRVPVK